MDDEVGETNVVTLDFPEERSVVTMPSTDSAAVEFASHHKRQTEEVVENDNYIPYDATESTPATEVKEIGVLTNVVVDKELNDFSRHCTDQENHQAMNLSLLLNTEGKLYGREQEKALLFEAFHRRTATLQGNNEIVLVTGQSGTGKTALANTLREPVDAYGGYFISGKFDQMQKSEPYATFIAAFTEYTNLVIDKGEETMSSTKEAILNALESETRFVTDMIPALELIVGPQESEMSSLQQVDAQKRHNSVFCKFVQAICSSECPLVLLIDDLQWSDPGSVDLLELLITADEIKGFMLKRFSWQQLTWI